MSERKLRYALDLNDTSEREADQLVDELKRLCDEQSADFDAVASTTAMIILSGGGEDEMRLLSEQCQGAKEKLKGFV